MRYKPNSKTELASMQKLEPVTRDGIFVGYEIDTNAQWTERVLIVDRADFERQKHEHNRRADIHKIHCKEISPEYRRFSRTLVWPVRAGQWAEARETTEGDP